MNTNVSLSPKQPLPTSPAQSAKKISDSTPETEVQAAKPSDSSESTEHNTKGTNNVSKRNTSSLDPNAMNFPSMPTSKPTDKISAPTQANINNLSETKLATAKTNLSNFEQETEALTKEEAQLSEALDNWKQNKLPGVSKVEAKQRLKSIQSDLAQRPEQLNKLKYEVIKEKAFTRSTAVTNWVANTDQTEQTVRPRSEILQGTTEKGKKALNALEYYAKNQTIDSFKDDENAPKFDIKEGMDLVYVKLMANVSSNQKTQEFSSILETLNATPGQKLSEQQAKTLEAYGILQNAEGELTNYMSGEKITAADLEDFGNIMDYQKAMVLNGTATEATLDNNDIAFSNETGLSAETINIVNRASEVLKPTSSNQVLASAQLSELLLDNSAQQLQTAITSAKQMREGLLADKEAISQSSSDLGAKIKELNQKQEETSQTVRSLSKLRGVTQVADFIENASVQKQQLLKEAGIEVTENSSGKKEVTMNGRVVSDGEIMRTLASSMNKMTAAVGIKLKEAEKEADGLQTRLDKIDEKLVEAGKTVKKLETSLKDHETQFADYQKNLKDVKALRNNPQEWSKLSADDQKALQELLDRSKDKISASRSLQKRGRNEHTALRKEITSTTRTLHRARHAIGRALKDLAGSGKLLKMMSDISKEAIEKEATHESSEVEAKNEEVIQFIEEANKLAQKLELAPKPDSPDVLELVKEWENILRETQERFDQITAEAGTQQLLEHKSLNHYAEQAQSLSDYTKDYIKNLSSVKREDLQRLTQDIRTFASGLASAI